MSPFRGGEVAEPRAVPNPDIKDTDVALMFLTQTLGNDSNRHSNEKQYHPHPTPPPDLLQLETTAPAHLGEGINGL